MTDTLLERLRDCATHHIQGYEDTFLQAADTIERLERELAGADKQLYRLGDELAQEKLSVMRANDKIAALEKDALRYRWLRESVGNPAYCVVATPWGLGQLYDDKLDAAIDAALAAQEKP